MDSTWHHSLKDLSLDVGAFTTSSATAVAPGCRSETHVWLSLAPLGSVLFSSKSLPSMLNPTPFCKLCSHTAMPPARASSSFWKSSLHLSPSSNSYLSFKTQPPHGVHPWVGIMPCSFKGLCTSAPGSVPCCHLL